MIQILLALLALVMPLSVTGATPETKSAQSPKEVPMMFVQSAKNVSFEGNKMTLKGIGPSTIFFSDRPERITGHMSLQQFLKEWDQGKDSFKKDPPNATLSTFEEKKVNYLVVELSNPQLKGDDLTYDVKILDGTPPAKGGLASLFIDWVVVNFGGPHCYRNFYNGLVYCNRPGWYPYYPVYPRYPILPPPY